MSEKLEKEFADLILKLQSLKKVGASEAFKNRIRKVPLPSLPSTEGKARIIPVFGLKLATFLAFFILLGGSSIALVAQFSRPGDLLYPVKKSVETIRSAGKKSKIPQPQIEPKAKQEDRQKETPKTAPKNPIEQEKGEKEPPPIQVPNLPQLPLLLEVKKTATPSPALLPKLPLLKLENKTNKKKINIKSNGEGLSAGA